MSWRTGRWLRQGSPFWWCDTWGHKVRWGVDYDDVQGTVYSGLDGVALRFNSARTDPLREKS